MGTGRTLLLIEDDDTTREVLTVLLEADGWRTMAAPSGEDALLLLEATDVPPVVILTDQQLPGIAGEALAMRLRDTLQERKAQAFLLGMSASVKEAPGFDAMLRKPFQAAEVKAVFEQLTADGGAAAHNGYTQKQQENTPALDEAVFLKLESQMGARVKDLYQFAIADANDRLSRMSQALLEGEAETFHREAHALKGSSGMIGARRLSSLAAQAEKFSSPTLNDLASHQLLTQMQHACDEIRLMLETRFPM